MRRPMMLALAMSLLTAAAAGARTPDPAGGPPVATPREMVQAYDSLADGILALKRTEWNMVYSILAVTYAHAQGAFHDSMAKIRSGEKDKAPIETLADLVSQLGNEGDASVAAVRKRLLEGGHHHATGEAQGIYDEGFVIVTKAARKVFLDAAGEIGRMAASPDAAALEAAWKKVAGQYRDLLAGARP